MSVKRAVLGTAAAATIALSWAVSRDAARAEGPQILVQSTTSTQNSGLYDYLLPIYRKETGVTVHVVAVGTGQALKNGRNCDGDMLVVHAKPAELKFVREGYGVDRHDLMYNDFVIVGPAADPAGIKGMKDVGAALKKIAAAHALFASRGDDSGTNKAEMRLWKAAGVDPRASSGGWYRETGSGMGATLNASVGMGAYTLTDRSTWISFRNKGDFAIDVQGDPRLFNQYGVMLINPKRCASVKAGLARQFEDWLLSRHGQQVIAAYHVDGQQLFFPNAR